VIEIAERKYQQPWCGKCAKFVKYIGMRKDNNNEDSAHYECKRCGVLNWLDVEFPEDESINY